MYLRSTKRSVTIEGMRIFFSTKLKLRLQSNSLQRFSLTRSTFVRVGGRRAFKRIRTLIRRSTTSIVVQTFIWKDDSTGQSIAKLLLDAANRGVDIRITKEPIGDFFELDESFAETKMSTAQLWKEFWNHPHISIDLTSKADHSKVWIFDGRIVLLSGMNIAQEYEHTWHDFQIELTGERYAEIVLKRKSDQKIDERQVEIVMNNNWTYRIRPRVLELIRAATVRIIVEHCYMTDPEIIAALATATKRNVQVTVLLPKGIDVNAHANIVGSENLRQQSNQCFLKILEYPTMFHSKILLIDGERCLIGSANFNTLSLDQSGEVCVLLKGRTHALKKIERRLKFDVLRSTIFSARKNVVVSRILARFGL